VLMILFPSCVLDSYPDECETCGQKVEFEDACIFVGLPTDLLKKYNVNTND